MKNAKRKPARRVVSRVSVGFFSMNLNGTDVTSEGYSRVEYDDGTFEETGTNPAEAAGRALADLMAKEKPKRGKAAR